MKIKQIVFNNINNLKGGPHVISFDEEPLKSAGIFAIVGPTGAGKSTILDVITLALFNRVPRLPSVSDRRIEKDGSIITHFAKKADASITYEVDGRSYTSIWSIRVASSGKVQPYHMEILDEAGNIISEKSAVPAKNESIIGLNYDQFVKSIILSQGDFSRFLKAKRDERSELLEKLTGSHIYRKVGKAAYNKNKEVQQALANQKSLLSEIQVLSTEDLILLQDEKKEASKITIQIEKQIKKNNTARIQKLTIITLRQKIEKKKEEFSSLKQKVLDFRNNDLTLERHDKVSFLRGDLTLYQSVKQNISKTLEAKSAYHSQHTEAKSDLETAIVDLAQLTATAVDQENFRKVMDAFESEVIILENQLKNLHEKGSETRSRLLQIVEISNTDFNANDKAEIAIAKLKADEELQLKIVDNHLLDIAQSKDRLKSMSDDLNVLNTIRLLKKNLDAHLSDKEEQSLRLNKFRADSEQHKVLLEKQKALNISLKENAKLLKKQKEDALKIAKLEDLRDQLLTGEPCPLCGSLDHPYENHFDVSPISEIDKRIATNEKEVIASEAFLRQQQANESEASTSIKIGVSRVEELILKIKVIQENIDLEKRKYNADPQYLESDISTLIVKLEGDVKDLGGKIASREKLQVIKSLLKEFHLLQDVGKQYAESKAQKLSLYQGEDVKKDSNKLQDRFISALTRVDKTKSFLSEKDENLQQFQNEFREITAKLEKQIPMIGVSSIDEMSDHILDEKRYLTLTQQKKGLEDRRISLKAELDQLEKDLKESIATDLIPETSLADLEATIQEGEAERDRLNSKIGEVSSQIKYDAKNRKTQEDRQKQIQDLEKEGDKWSMLNKMIGSAHGDKFANFAQDLTLKNLLVYTNIRLRDLTDRYLLDMPGESGTLTVVDRYQGDTERAVTTLSGGEIFILSLALAISLSDMASQNIALESLFIDEGFGTLDQETLDVAMSTLEKLQSENRKMVGVISHVEALKERIHVQIQLKKNAQGYSKIEVVG